MGALAQRKVMLLKKRSKLGQPCVLIVVRNHYMSKSTAVETRDLIVFCFDKVMSTFLSGMHGMGKAMIIVDLQNITWNSLDGDALKDILLTAQNYFPERLGAMVMWKPPTIFFLIWKMVSPFVDVKTRSKIQMIYKPKEMAKFMDLEEIPKSIGGMADEDTAVLSVEQIHEEDQIY